MARLTAPNGTVVSVGDDKVAGLVARGYAAEPKAKKASASAPTSKPSDK